MFNFLKKSKNSANAKVEVRKPSTGTKKVSNTGKKRNLSPEQNMNLAAEKLEATARRLDTKKRVSSETPASDKQKLIKQALNVQKAQSKLLDDLDDDTRRRLKALAIELMVFKKEN